MNGASSAYVPGSSYVSGRPAFSSSLLGSPARVNPNESHASHNPTSRFLPRGSSPPRGALDLTTTPRTERRLHLDTSTTTPRLGASFTKPYLPSSTVLKRDPLVSTPKAGFDQTEMNRSYTARSVSDSVDQQYRAGNATPRSSFLPSAGRVGMTTYSAAPAAPASTYTAGGYNAGIPSRAAAAAPTPLVAELERKLEGKQFELSNMQRKLTQLEDELSQQKLRGDTKVLEGRIAGLESMVQEKTATLECERQEKQAFRLKCEELNQHLHHKASLLEKTEHEKGEGSAFLVVKNLEIEKASAETEELRARLMHQLDATAALENGRVALEAERDSVAAALRQDLSHKTTEISNHRLRIEELQEGTEKLSAQNAALLERLERQQAQRNDEKRQSDDLMHANQALEAELSQRTVLIAGKADELRRETNRTQEAESRIAEAEAHARNLESHIRDLESVGAQKAALETKLEVLEGAMQRNEEDLAGEGARHRISKQRIAELEARLHASEGNMKTIKMLEHELHLKTDSIAQLRSKEERRVSQRDETSHTLDFEVARRKQVEEELAQAGAQREDLLQKLSDMEVEMVQKSGYEGKAKGLQEVLALRSLEIEELNKRNNVLTDRLKQLQLENDGISRLKSDLTHSEDQREHLSRELSTLRANFTDFEVSAEKAKAMRREEERAKGDLEDEVRRRDAQIDSLRAEVERREAAMHQLDKTKGQLEERNVENAELASQLAATQTTLTAQKHDHASLEQRARTLEEELADKTSAIDDAHMRVGEHGAHLDTLRDECERLRSEAQWLTEQNRHLDEQHSRAVDDATAKGEHIARIEERARQQAAECEQLRSERESAQELAAHLDATLAKQNGVSEEMQTRLAILEEHGARSAQLEGNIKALESVLIDSSDEKTRDGQRIADLTNQLLAAEAQVSSGTALEGKMADLQKQMATQVTTIEHLEETVRERNTLLKDTMREANALQSANSELRGRLEELVAANKELTESAAHLKDAHAQRGQLEGRVNGLEAVLRDREEDLERSNGQAKHLQQRLRSVEAASDQNGALEARIEVLSHTLKTKEEIIDRLESQDLRRRSAENDLNADLEATATKTRTLEADLASEVQARCALELRLKDVEQEAEGMLQHSVAEVNDLKAVVKRLSVENRTLETSIQSDTGASRRVVDQVSKLSSENKRLLDAVSQLEAEKERRSIENAELSRQGDSLRADLQGSNQQMVELQTRLLASEKEVKSFRTTAVTKENKLTTDLRLSEQQTRTYETTNRELQREVEEREKRLNEKTEQLRREREDNTNTEQRIRELQDHNLQLQRSINDLELRLTESSRTSQAVSGVREEMGATIAAKEGSISLLTKKNTALQTRLTTEAANTKSLEHEVSSLSHTVSLLEGENQDLQRRAQSADNTMHTRLSSTMAERYVEGHGLWASIQRALKNSGACTGGYYTVPIIFEKEKKNRRRVVFYHVRTNSLWGDYVYIPCLGEVIVDQVKTQPLHIYFPFPHSEALQESTSSLRNELNERVAAEQEKERTYKKTIHALTQKWYVSSHIFKG